MAEYVLRSDVIDTLQTKIDGTPRAGQGKMTVYEATLRVQALDSVDAEPVVRCKKCKWYDCCRCTHPSGIIAGPVGPLFYCKNGEKRHETD